MSSSGVYHDPRAFRRPGAADGCGVRRQHVRLLELPHARADVACCAPVVSSEVGGCDVQRLGAWRTSVPGGTRGVDRKRETRGVEMNEIRITGKLVFYDDGIELTIENIPNAEAEQLLQGTFRQYASSGGLDKRTLFFVMKKG